MIEQERSKYYGYIRKRPLVMALSFTVHLQPLKEIRKYLTVLLELLIGE
jgi:hypothetical protein